MPHHHPVAATVVAAEVVAAEVAVAAVKVDAAIHHPVAAVVHHEVTCKF